MKITVVCDALGSLDNGTAIAATALVRAMKKRGHEVVVVCSDEAKAGKEGYLVISRRGSRFGKRNFEKGILEDAVWDSDAVHIMTPFMLGSAAVKLCKKHLIPVSADFYVQTEGLHARLRPSRLTAANRVTYRRYYLNVYRYADAVRYPSELSRNLFEKTVGHETKAYVIPNGVDGRFHPNGAQKPRALSDQFIILYCADYSREKNHGVLIDAAALSKYSDTIQLIFAGSGPMKSALKKQGMKLKNQPILTAYPYSQLPNLYNYADLYVHPALVDMNASSCMEALACGLVPLIADSPRSAAKRFAPDGSNLFESRNAQALADMIDRIIEQPEVLTTYREQYKGIVGELTQDVCMDRMEEMLYDIR
ncbi:MAG: glycosyltransferase [Ruminococcus sp.]|uniref:glycosyltransferase n=1 Tax=Ruminococcus sp. TaxID=41978 RepID=UPI0028734531|nr:glycosyltransferase [Ruminococcus sp.]MBQ3285714.1 glycosyltransferase [Ruminococcus sp.]